MASIFVDPCKKAQIASAGGDAVCPSRNWVLAASVLGSSLAFIDGTVVNVALPVIQTAFHANAAEMQWIVESYALTLAALILIGGALGDRYGRRLAFASGAALFAATSLLCGLAQNTEQLILARALQGCGAALLVPGSLALIAASFPKEERGRAIGVWSAATALTMAFGPVAGGWLADNLSWRWIFFINLPIAAAVLAITFLKTPESRNEADRGPLDWPGAGLCAVGLGGAVYGLIEASHLGLAAPRVWISIVTGLAFIAAFLWRQRTAENPMAPPALFANRAFSGVNLMTFLVYGALTAILFFLPLYLIQVRGYSATAAAAAFLPFVFMMIIFSSHTGALADRVGARLLLTAGPVITAAGFGLLALLARGDSYWLHVLPAVLLMSAGMVITVAPLTATVLAAAPDERAGLASGVNNAVSRAAGLIAIAAFSLFFTSIANDALAAELRDALPAAAARDEAIASLRYVFGALDAPASLDANIRAAAENAADTAFIAGFRAVGFAAAALSLAAAAAGWASLSGKA